MVLPYLQTSRGPLCAGMHCNMMPQQEDCIGSSSSNESSFSTVSSTTLDGNGIGCSSIFSRLRGRTGRHRLRPNDRSQIKIRTSPYPRIHDRIFSRHREDVRKSSGLRQLLSESQPDRPNVSGASMHPLGENAVDGNSSHDEASTQKEADENDCVDLIVVAGNNVSCLDGQREIVDKRPEECTQAKKAGDLSSTIAEIFRCFICLGKLVDAQLCPCCSKLVCMLCIKRWLTDQKSECPHCRASLLVSQLVSCKFISEITTEVEKIQGSIEEDTSPEKLCATHGSQLSYFCTTCSTAVCSDCAILAEEHQNHTFERLNVTYGRQSEKLHAEASGLRSCLKELYTMVAVVDKEIEAVLKAKDGRATEIDTAYKRMRAKLEEQLKCKLLTLLAQKGTMSQKVELLETILRQLDFQLSTSSKSDLIAQEPTMTSILQDLQKRVSTNIKRTPVSTDFVSEVVPPFEYGELILKKFKNVLTPANGKSSNGNDSFDTADSTNGIIYSAPISATGVIWRLKVYPNGSGASKGNHISVFLEMVKGGPEPTTYEYVIEMLHRTQPHQKVVRRFSSDFEEGACWGYYQFYKIDDLEKEGYLLPDEDTITLNFYVRAQTFLQQCLDLRRALSACQIERDEAVTQVAVLRRAFAASIWQQRRRKSNSICHLDGQGSIKHVLAGAVSSLLPSNRSLKQFGTKSMTTKAAFSRLDRMVREGGSISNSSITREVAETRRWEVKHATDGPGGIGSEILSLVADDNSEMPSMAISRNSMQPGSKEKCELWLRSRDNLFQMPASKNKSSRRSRYKSNRPFGNSEAGLFSKRTRRFAPESTSAVLVEKPSTSSRPGSETVT